MFDCKVRPSKDIEYDVRLRRKISGSCQASGLIPDLAARVPMSAFCVVVLVADSRPSAPIRTLGSWAFRSWAVTRTLQPTETTEAGTMPPSQDILLFLALSRIKPAASLVERHANSVLTTLNTRRRAHPGISSPTCLPPALAGYRALRTTGLSSTPSSRARS